MYNWRAIRNLMMATTCSYNISMLIFATHILIQANTFTDVMLMLVNIVKPNACKEAIVPMMKYQVSNGLRYVYKHTNSNRISARLSTLKL